MKRSTVKNIPTQLVFPASIVSIALLANIKDKQCNKTVHLTSRGQTLTTLELTPSAVS
jgi:hypothetical protein